MNIFAIAGIIVGLAGILFGYIADEGVLSALVKIPALSIVFGGTFGIMLAANPLSRLKKIPAALKLTYMSKKPDVAALIDSIMEISVVARRDGLLALETESSKFDNPVLKKGLTYIADGISPERLKQNLEAESEAMIADFEEAARVFEGMGGAAPTMGVLGTVMGMVSILRDMSDMNSLGGKIATAFIATMYGVGSANILWLPIGSSIKAAAEEEGAYYKIMIEGLVAIQAGEYPTRIKEYLIAMSGPSNAKKFSSDSGEKSEKGGKAKKGKAAE